MLQPFGRKKGRGFSWTLLIVLFVTAIAPRSIFGDELLEVEFNLCTLPSSRQALVALNSPALATFEKRPLGECLKTLASAYRVSVWVDRRVDLSRLVTIVGAGASEPAEAKTTLGRLVAVARLGGADAGLVENVVYVGPAGQVGAVQRAAVRLHNEIMTYRPANPVNNQAELRTLSWEDITTPSELLASIQNQWSVKVYSELPHDLMHAGDLPSSTLATQLTLLHAGFNQQVECDRNGSFTTNSLADISDWKANYAEKELQLDRLVAARKEFNKATVQTKGKVSTVTGPTGFHLRLLSSRVPMARMPEPKYRIPEFRAPIERVIGDLAKHLGMDVKWSEQIPENKRKEVMTFAVPVEKTVNEILKQIADQSKLKIQRREQTIEVLP